MTEPLTSMEFNGARAQFAIMVTRRCNMTCAHCSVESGPKVTGEPSESDLMDWVRQAATAGVRLVRITGGEPMLRQPVVLRLLRECRRLGMATTITTNGFWGRTPAKAMRTLRALRRAGISNLVVSYDKYHADFQGPEPVRHIAQAAAKLGVDLNVTMVRSAADGPNLIDVLDDPEIAARVRVYDLQPVGRGRELLSDQDAGAVEGFCAACAFPALAEDGRVMACNGPAYFERPDSPLVLGSIRTTPLVELLDRHTDDPILDTIRTRGPAGLRDELGRTPGFENFAFRSNYRGICDLCHHITRDTAAVAALRPRLARPESAAVRRAAWQVIVGNRSRGALGADYVNGIGACRIFLRAAWQPDLEFDDDPIRIFGSAHLDWRRLADYLAGCGMSRLVTHLLDRPEMVRWAPPFFRDAVRQRGVSEGLRQLVQRDVLEQVADELRQLGGDGVLLKGSAVPFLTPQGRVPRATSDIDIVVDPKLAPELRARLLKRGFKGVPDLGMQVYHHMEPISSQGVPIEVHTRIMAGFWGLPEREMLADIRPIAEIPGLSTLGPEAFAFHAIVHTSGSFFSFGLKTAWDVRLATEIAPDFDWARLASWAAQLPAPRTFWAPMGALANALDLGVPREFLRKGPIDLGARRAEELVRKRIFRATDRFVDLDVITKAGMMLLLQNGLIGSARYLGAKLWWRGIRPRTWTAAVGRARRADMFRQAWRNYRKYKRAINAVGGTRPGS